MLNSSITLYTEWNSVQLLIYVLKFSGSLTSLIALAAFASDPPSQKAQPMSKQFLFMIGPLIDENEKIGANAYFRIPSDGAPIFADSLKDAIVNVDLPHTDLAIDEFLAHEARAIGLSVRPPTNEEATLAALIALDLAAPGHYSEISDDELLWRFLDIYTDYLKRIDTFEKSDRFPMQAVLQFIGGTHRSAFIFQNGGVTILDDFLPDATDVLKDLQTLDGVGVFPESIPPACKPHLSRAFGLRRVPHPFRLENQKKTPLGDFDLALLSATLRAFTDRDLRAFDETLIEFEHDDTLHAIVLKLAP